MTPKKLLIYLSSSATDIASWIIYDQDGSIESINDQNNINLLRNTPKDIKTTVIITGEDVLLTTVTLPKLNKQKTIQALPFALEDKLIDDTNSLHFALGKKQENQKTPVAIISKEKLDRYLKLLKEVSITPNKVIPETLAIAYKKNHWQICILDNKCVIRTSDFSGYVVEPENVLTILELEQQKPETINIYSASEIKINLNSLNIKINKIKINNIFDVIKDYHDNSYINLLQNKYLVTKKTSLRNNIWAISGCITISWIALLFLTNIISFSLLNKNFDSLDKQINTIYNKNFPNSSSVVAPKKRMEEKLKKITSNTSNNNMLSQLSIIGESLHNSGNLKIDQLTFNGNSYSLKISTSTFKELRDFVESIRKKNLKVKQQNASINDQKITANLIIQKGIS
ncbi:type II secretion system protein GspL [Gammaproteobacteria bacterium]|nr:type II secretion system protein GspL [Gammaproteobacteria bacterium]